MRLQELVSRQLPKWQRLLTSPAPTTAWVLDGSMIGAIRRDAKNGVLHCAVEAMPEGTVEIGPIGLQAVDRQRLQAVLSSVQGRVEGARRAAVVLPTGWIRAHLLDFEELPRRQTEIDQVVLWRLKKLLPVLPSELRVSTFPSQSPDGTKRLLCMVGVERVLADLESAFAEVGVEPGMVTPRLFALAHGRAAGSEILMQQESGFLSLLLVVDGAPQLLRTKPQTAGTETSEGISRELRLASGFIRDELGVSDGVAVTISAESGDADQALRTWWSDQDWVRIEEEAAAMPFINQEEAEKLGWARIAPVLGLIEGAAQ